MVALMLLFTCVPFSRYLPLFLAAINVMAAAVILVALFSYQSSNNTLHTHWDFFLTNRTLYQMILLANFILIHSLWVALFFFLKITGNRKQTCISISFWLHRVILKKAFIHYVIFF